MADSSTLQERLREHSKTAFDGILSLIPAKLYYGEDTSDQWRKKKQTKEEAAAARRAKLDPENAGKSALEVMEERQRKRKLEEDDDSDNDGAEKEQPKEGLKTKKQKFADTPKKDARVKAISTAPVMVNEDEAIAARKAKFEAKKLKKQERKEKEKAKLEKRKAKKENCATESVDFGIEDDNDIEVEVAGLDADEDEGQELAEVAVEDPLAADAEMNEMQLEGMADENDDAVSTATSSPGASPLFDETLPTQISANTSTSSTVPPAKAPKAFKMPTDPELLKRRLAARIEELRAARKADGSAKNRQELMETRRKKEEQRKAHKKELRLKAKLEEEAQREEALASARNSPAISLLSPALDTAGPDNNFSFGRVAFADGQQLTGDLSRLNTAPKKRGPQDPKTALEAAEKKRLRLSGLDEGKRADIEEKDMWLGARKRAHGEKVRDDTSLLKKTLKRKEKMKKKSEGEWKERKDGIAKSQAMNQKKRETNLQKRKDESKKGKAKLGKAGGKKAGGGKKGPKVKSRPGFEGSFGGGKRK